MGIRFQNKKLIIIPVILLFLIITIFITGMILKYNKTKSFPVDINQDGNIDSVIFKQNKVSVIVDDEVVWQSDKSWKIDDFIVGDINHDSKPELLILLWKKGSFGEHVPFWEEKETDTELTQHLFIYQWQDSSINSIWMSSKLQPEIKSFDMLDDGKIHIVTKSKEDTVWMWSDFGLERYK